MDAHSYLDIIVRSAAVYLFMLGALRIFGKKELSQLNTGDVILVLLISNSVQNAMVGNNTSLWGGITAAGILFLLNFAVKKFLFRFKAVGKLLQDKPVILIYQGKPDYKALAKVDITHDEIMEAIREHGIEFIKEVKLAMLEMDGNISIITGEKDLKQTHYKRRRNRSTFVNMD